jgi:hypothetical protein
MLLVRRLRRCINTMQYATVQTGEHAQAATIEPGDYIGLPVAHDKYKVGTAVRIINDYDYDTDDEDLHGRSGTVVKYCRESND